jgi:hypothetical protein
VYPQPPPSLHESVAVPVRGWGPGAGEGQVYPGGGAEVEGEEVVEPTD